MSNDLLGIKPVNSKQLRKHRMLQLSEIAIAVLLLILIGSGMYILLKAPKNAGDNPNVENLKAEVDNLNKKIDELNGKLQASAGGSSSAESQSSQGKININTASEEELDTLPGIGKTYAGAIVDYRNQNGGFKSVEDLLNVKGIGAKTLENMRDYVTL